jgi:RND family efflux transporter MFP subunit
VIIVLLLLIVSVLVAKHLNKDSAGVIVETAELQKGNIRSDIFIDGKIKAKEESQIVLDLPYPVTDIYVEEGDKVKKGDVLAKLDTKTLELEVIKSEINLQIEQKNLEDLVSGISNLKLKQELENAKKEYENAKKELDRYIVLLEEGAISTEEIEQKETIYEKAKNTYELALENINSNDDLIIQEKKVEQQKADIALLEEKLENAIIKSPIDGVIVTSNTKKGILATSSNVLFIIDNTDELEIEVNISEFDVNNIKLGQEVLITGDAFEGIEFKGKVTYIAPSAQITRTSAGEETSVKVKINIENPTDKLKPGFTADVTINTGLKENILKLPYEAVFRKKDGDYVIYKVDNDTINEIPVDVGIEGVIYIEIISDKLKEGDKVVLNPQENLTDGMKVRIMEESGLN